MKRIDKFYAWIVTDKNGDEGLPAIMLEGVWYPAIGADKHRIESFRNQIIAMGLPAKLVEFTNMETLEKINDGP